MTELKIGDRVLDESTDEFLYYLDNHYMRLTLVSKDGTARLVSRSEITESMATFRLSSRAKTRMRVGVKTKLAQEAEALERARESLSFAAHVPSFTVARLIELMAKNQLALADYFRTGAEREAA